MRAIAFAALATAVLLLQACPNARADDFGPPREIAALRSDAKTLLASSARNARATPDAIVVTDVVVVSGDALYSWRVGAASGLSVLKRIRNQWWERLRVIPRPLEDCALRSASLRARGVADALLRAASLHNAMVRLADRPKPVEFDPLGGRGIVCIESSDAATVDRIAPAGGSLAVSPRQTDGYVTTLTYAKNSSTGNARFIAPIGRMPTDAESTQAPRGDSFYYFDISLAANGPLAFERGGRLDVWFPHVLATTLRYSLTIGFADKPIGPIDGALHDNTLTFDLPAFTATPGITLMAEIDGD
jgi:hypothetical protein